MKYQVMLAKVGTKDLLKSKDWIFEPKLDGTRVLIYKTPKKISLINRRGKDITYRYPELKDMGKNIEADSCVLDGELVVLNKQGKPDFNLLQEREQLSNKFLIEIRSKLIPATVFVFDVLEVNKKSLVDEPLLQRKKYLQKILKSSSYISLCPFTFEGTSLWKEVKSQDLEGIMAKRKNSWYEGGKRSENWLKIKNLSTIDAVIIGFVPGKGARKKTFGALLLGTYENKKLIYIGKVGTGFDRKTLEYLSSLMKKLTSKKSPLDKKEQAKIENAVWIKPKIIVEVKYLELTNRKELRAPTFLRLRFDKKISECVLQT